jgi:hypothetical protein
VERIFSKGWIILSHIRKCLSAQSIRALMCVGEWSKLGYVRDKDVLVVTIQPDVEGNKEDPLLDKWDAI